MVWEHNQIWAILVEDSTWTFNIIALFIHSVFLVPFLDTHCSISSLDLTRLGDSFISFTQSVLSLSYSNFKPQIFHFPLWLSPISVSLWYICAYLCARVCILKWKIFKFNDLLHPVHSFSRSHLYQVWLLICWLQCMYREANTNWLLCSTDSIMQLNRKRFKQLRSDRRRRRRFWVWGSFKIKQKKCGELDNRSMAERRFDWLWSYLGA